MFILATWETEPSDMVMRVFETRDAAERAAYQWMIENSVVNEDDPPLREAMDWWEDEGQYEDWGLGCVIRAAQAA